MKKISVFCSCILTAVLIIIACNTKEIVLVTNVELEFSQNTTNSGFVNDLLPATFVVTPEAFLPEFEYYLKYEVLEGQGVFLNSDAEELPEGEDILLTKLEEETNFSLALAYKGLSAGNHRVKVTASDNFDKAIEVVLQYTIDNIPVVWTAVANTDQLTLGTTTTATVTLENNTNAPNLTFERSYNFSEGAGRLLDTSGILIVQNQTAAINPGVFLITIEPTVLGTNTITFNLEDSNGQLLNNTITLEVLEEDVTPPVIALNGSNSIQVTVGSTYTEQGATATDNVDGTFDVPASGITGTVDATTIGAYILAYDVSDAAGNAATTVTRTVNVVAENTLDTEAPVITLNGPATLDITVGGTYTEQGATATDNVDGTFDVPASGITGTVDPTIIGAYILAYDVSDAAGNAATTVTRTVNVVAENTLDTEAPVITLNGPATLEITVGGTYTEQGATATDNVDGTFDVPTSGITGTVDPTIIGAYILAYDVSDAAGNAATTVTRTVNVVVENTLDTEAPVITLNGPATLDITVGGTYTEQGATATDNVDGTFDVPTSGITGTVDPTIIGAYILAYDVSDAAGNAATTVTRTVNVVAENTSDTEAPVITLNGPATLDITVGGTYSEQGATATDNVDGTFDVPTSGITGTVDATTIGAYILSYDVSDAAGNAATTVTRTVNVVVENTLDTEAPVITLNGPATLDITVGGTYTEQGATATDNVDGTFDVPASGITGTVDPTIIGAYILAYDVSDAAGNAATTVTRTVNVVAENENPIATITADITIGIAPLTVQFLSNASDPNMGDALTYSWLFGDGATSNEVNPTHIYTTPSDEDYTVLLTVTDGNGGMINDNLEITVNGPNTEPELSMSATPTTGAAPLTVQFSSSTSDADGDTITYLWNFGDGTTATQANPSHIYTIASATPYIVTLIIADGNGGTANDALEITVNSIPNEDPVAVITTTATSGPAPLTVSFGGGMSTDDGTIASYLWDFDDNGAANTAMNTSYTFSTAGTYDVTLTVTDDLGATDSATTTITVNEVPNSAPTAVASASVTSGIAPLTVDFDSSASFDSDGTIGDIIWDFDDNGALTATDNPTYTFNTAGTYVVELTVRDNEDAPGTDTVTIEVVENSPPNAIAIGAPSRGTAPLEVVFSSNLSTDEDGTIVAYDWDFDDNGAVSNLTSPSHTFTAKGIYIVELTVTDNNGATASNTYAIEVLNTPPNIEITSNIISDNNFVPFTIDFDSNASDPDGDALTYLWDFGDGNTATTENTSHTYTTAGTFRVDLSVSDGTTSATDTEIVLALVAPNNSPVATNFTRTVEEGESIITPAGFVASDADGDTLIISGVEPIPSNRGTISIDANELSFTYTAPSTGAPFTVFFDYTVSDGTDTDTGTMTVNVTDRIVIDPCTQQCPPGESSCGECNKCYEQCP